MTVTSERLTVSSKRTGRKTIAKIILVCLLLAFFPPGGSAAQQTSKIPRIGFLAASTGVGENSRPAAVKEGLSDLGYVEGKSIIIEWRQAGGKLDRLAGFADELVRLKVDVILTAGSTATGAAKGATNTIPIVMVQDNDPVGSGFITSLARPGGNITGLSTLRPEISGKRLELLKEIVPGLSRVAVLGSSNNPGNAEGLKETELAAAALKLQIHYLDVRTLKDIEPAFHKARTGRADAILVLGGPLFNVRQKEFVAHAAKSQLPAIYVRQNFVISGGLMSYGVNLADLQRRAAIYVDKILKGAKPAELPVEQPTKFELVINLKTAKQIGLTIPPNVLARADRVIR
jgi:putative ABC transport system substrate-binding protein